MLSKMIESIKSYNPNTDEALIRKAFEFAKDAHKGQLRNSGEEYFIHPAHVALILSTLHMDDATIIAGLMHDVLEDTEYTYEQMSEEFSEEIAVLVDGVTKLKKIKYKSKQENQVENLRKMVMAMANDIRVIIIKLADRLHNMRTLEYMTRQKQIEKATETLEIYAPLAHRLGISTIKSELEDLSLRYLEPDVYYELAGLINKKLEEREEYIKQIIEDLRARLQDLESVPEITGRPKSLYSIYKKMYQQDKTFDQLFDLTAIRIIVGTEMDCYKVLGAVHALWKPIPDRFKDYIAMPKPNMYRSLHNTVIGPKGETFEVQIRTWEMHRTAEFGIAAHWRYKEGTSKSDNFDQKLTWVRQLMEWQKDTTDSKEYMETLKGDFFNDEVYVFSPKGDVVNLPVGATPIDFAYRVHSAVGNSCVGAKINGRIVPLTYQLKNGNIVEILTSSNSSGPSRDWLNMAKSSQAKSKIKQWFKKEQRDQNIVQGRDALEKEVRKDGYRFNEILKDEWIQKIANRLSFNAVEDLYAAIGFGSVQLTQIVPKLKEYHGEYYQVDQAIDVLRKDANLPSHSNVKHGIRVQNVDDLAVKFAKCCNPVPGDEIIGYITKGRGVSVHRADCNNITINADPDRLIDVYWDNTTESKYQVEIQIISFDRSGYLSLVIQIINKQGFNVTGMNAKPNKDKTFTINFTIEIKDIAQLDPLMSAIRKLNDTIDIYRVKS